MTLVTAGHIDAEGFEFVGIAAAAYAQLQASAAERINDRGILRDAQRMFKGQHHDRRAQAQATRALGNRRQKGKRGGQAGRQAL